jgi:hypothetical protein
VLAILPINRHFSHGLGYSQIFRFHLLPPGRIIRLLYSIPEVTVLFQQRCCKLTEPPDDFLPGSIWHLLLPCETGICLLRCWFSGATGICPFCCKPSGATGVCPYCCNGI